MSDKRTGPSEDVDDSGDDVSDKGIDRMGGDPTPDADLPQDKRAPTTSQP